MSPLAMFLFPFSSNFLLSIGRVVDSVIGGESVLASKIRPIIEK